MKGEKMDLIEVLQGCLYISALERIITILPQLPPKRWYQDGFKKAKRKAKVITKRLMVFGQDEWMARETMMLEVGSSTGEEESAYIKALDKCMRILRKAGLPKHWKESDFKLAKAYAQIIMRRLDTFNRESIQEK
jgi:hypothetical protein